jgi:DNA protecting protein DprA
MSKSGAKKQPLRGEAAQPSVDPASTSRLKPPQKIAQPHARKKPAGHDGPLPPVDQSIQDAVGVTVDELTSLYILDSLKGFGPQKFKELYSQGITPAAVVRDPTVLPTAGKRGDLLRALLFAERQKSEPVCRRRAVMQILAAHRHGARIVTYKDSHYPPNVFESNYPAPILFVRGSLEVLTLRNAVACVGSRKIRPPYVGLETEFVRTACRRGFTVVSGFALGADTIGHQQAWKAGGKTICVMPGGLDRPFPPENRHLWDELLHYSGAAFVSELGFGARASSLTLRKRNKLIVAFARGVLIAQSAKDGGAMNAFRFAVEQKKPIATFQADDAADMSGNRLIAADSGRETLPGDRMDLEAYERWLRQLSFSTSMEPSGTVTPGMPRSSRDSAGTRDKPS